MALKTKAEGTALYQGGDIQGAINKYSLAIQQCPDAENKNKAMLHNNIGICLVKMYENKESEKPPASAAEEEKKDDGVFSFAKNKKANTEKDKAYASAKEHFTKAIELDDKYIKPLYQRMMLLK